MNIYIFLLMLTHISGFYVCDISVFATCLAISIVIIFNRITSIPMIIVFTLFTLHTDALNIFMLVKYRAQIKIQSYIFKDFIFDCSKNDGARRKGREIYCIRDDESLATASNSSESSTNANDRRWRTQLNVHRLD